MELKVHISVSSCMEHKQRFMELKVPHISQLMYGTLTKVYGIKSTTYQSAHVWNINKGLWN